MYAIPSPMAYLKAFALCFAAGSAAAIATSLLADPRKWPFQAWRVPL